MPDRLIKRAEALHRQAGKLLVEHQRLYAELERIYRKFQDLRDVVTVKKDARS